MDELSAMTQLHTHAVYLHDAETYFVEELDFDKKIAFVRRQDLDYYTQAVQVSQIRRDTTEVESECGACGVGFGDVTVTTQIPMFKKVKFQGRDSLGFEKLELPPQEMETVAMWLVPPDSVKQALAGSGCELGDALAGLANVLVQVAPLFVMCDEQDIGVVVDASNLGTEAIFLFDRYPGGMGYAERCMEVVGPLLDSVHAVLESCPCELGCPSCVGAATPAFAAGDIDAGTRGRIPDKAGAKCLLQAIRAASEA
jgi:DEAD/DEAH box helicase domain-containing protein